MKDSLAASFEDFSKEIKKNLKILIQNLQNNKSYEKNQNNVVLNSENDNSYSLSDYNSEIQKMKNLITTSQKYFSTKQNLSQNLTNSSEQQAFLSISNSCEETSSLLEQLGLDSSEFSKIFTSAFDNVLKKSESFSSSMKNMLNDLKNYFIKTAAKAISSSFIPKQDSDNFLNSLFPSSNNSSSSVSSVLSSFLGLFNYNNIPSHHSGGFIAPKAGYSIPGTKEYLALLKGGERVLSPAENASLSNDSGKQGQVVVNNFNIKAWDSKDVQKYLLENKNLLANITADNIKYNNANLRYMIGG